MIAQLPPVLDVATAAGLLQCAGTTVQEMARQGQLPGLKVGTDWVFPVGAFFKRLDELALEQAEKRRSPPTPSAVLTALPRRAKRTPPALPFSATALPDPRP